jgi:hypothetical protein
LTAIDNNFKKLFFLYCDCDNSEGLTEKDGQRLLNSETYFEYGQRLLNSKYITETEKQKISSCLAQFTFEV